MKKIELRKTAKNKDKRPCNICDSEVEVMELSFKGNVVAICKLCRKVTYDILFQEIYNKKER